MAKVADIISQFCRRQGMEFAFGMSGANIEDVHMAFHRGGGPKPIIVKHEANAVACAEGYDLASQMPGLVFSTSGGGAFNLIPSLIEARGNGVPMFEPCRKS